LGFAAPASKEQDYSAEERGRRAETQARSEIGPYRRDCALPNIDRHREAWPSERRSLSFGRPQRPAQITAVKVLDAASLQTGGFPCV